MRSMISISGLSKSFEGRSVLKDINLSIISGETVVLLGPSGSGKSTLLRCIVGLTRFDGGEIEMDGLRLSADMREADRRQAIARIRRQCGMVFQQYHLFPHKTVHENLTLAPVKVEKSTIAAATDRASDLLEQMWLVDKADKYPHQLSGGEQQRIAVARALAMNPQYLLYDEPTSALDPVRARAMWELMAGLANQGLTQIIVTHQEQIQDALPCRVIRLQDGTIVE